MGLAQLRQEYHTHICADIIRTQWDAKKQVEYPNFADGSNRASVVIAASITRQLGCALNRHSLTGQTTGGLFEKLTRDFLEKAFGLLRHLRPGRWVYSTSLPISHFDQYSHLAELQGIVQENRQLAAALGTDYIITPDIVIGRWPVTDEEVNQDLAVIEPDAPIARLTPFRALEARSACAILHASISCKWTIRSDRSQNARTEALNLIRNRKGRLPHILAVTAEPLPTRIASLALGTGDLDCVYHFALYELEQAIKEADNEDQMDMLQTLIQGRRLRDISDLPFDLAA